MKINERTLIAYSTAQSTPVDREGWMWKRGEVNRSFQKRYFVLRGNLLFYFEKKSDREPVGVIIMEGCTIELAEEEHEKFAFKIAFHGEGKRTYILGTESQETLEGWMKALACSSYDYMKLMVAELEQQLKELEETEQDSEEPKAPPRQRTNPLYSSNDDTKKTKKTWPVLHAELGQRIIKDRAKWCDLRATSEEPLIHLA